MQIQSFVSNLLKIIQIQSFVSNLLKQLKFEASFSTCYYNSKFRFQNRSLNNKNKLKTKPRIWLALTSWKRSFDFEKEASIP